MHWHQTAARTSQTQLILQSTLCLKKTSPTFLAITQESIDGFL